MNLGIDPGKYGLKAATIINGVWHTHYIRSKITENPSGVMPGRNYLVEHEQRGYLVGEGADDYSLDTSKHSIQHKLITYLGIQELADDSPTNIVIGCPFNLFKNNMAREMYEDYMMGEGLTEIKVNGSNKLINISNLQSFPECAGTVWAEPNEDFEDTERAVIEIGGLNVIGCVFTDFNPVDGSDFTENLGSIIFKNKVRQELNSRFPEANIQEYEINSIIKNGLEINGIKIPQVKEIIDDVFGEHFELIIKAAKKKNWSVKTLKITASGGGLLDIGIDTIRRYIPQVKSSQDPLWGNAKGNYLVANSLF